MPTIIVENDVSQWDDLTGEVYHFPKRYKELLLPGEKVIYYKGRIKDKSFKNQRLSPDPHYFGIAEIGKIISIKDGKELLGEIINFRPFIKAVNFQDSEGYLEKIPKNKEKNYWRDGVRKIDEETYKRIVDLENLGPVREAKSSVNTDDQSFVSGVEGRQSYSFTTKYERDPELRKQALLIHGYVCAACSFNFEKFYGEYAKGFIHIHHIEPLFESGEKVVNPETDLIPLCANCHAIIHRRRNKTLNIEELKNMIDQNKL